MKISFPAITAADGKEAEAFYRERLGDSAILIPGALELCRDLSRKYDLYVVTNGVADTQYRRLKSSGLDPYFKGIFVSEEAKSPKPQKEFFEYCFEQMRLLGVERPKERRREMLFNRRFSYLRYAGRGERRRRHLLVQSEEAFQR